MKSSRKVGIEIIPTQRELFVVRHLGRRAAFPLYTVKMTLLFTFFTNFSVIYTKSV